MVDSLKIVDSIVQSTADTATSVADTTDWIVENAKMWYDIGGRLWMWMDVITFMFWIGLIIFIIGMTESFIRNLKNRKKKDNNTNTKTNLQ